MWPLPAQQGLHGNRAGGDQAALGFLGNSRAEPGNTSSGRKAAAVRREPRARLAEQAPDTLSVQSFRRPALLRLAPPPFHSTWPEGSGWYGWLFRSQCPGSGPEGICSTEVVPCSPLVALVGAEVGSLCAQGGNSVLARGYPGPRECSAPRLPCPGLACPHTLLPASGDSPQLPWESRKGGAEPQVVTGPEAVVTSGFDGPARWGCQRVRRVCALGNHPSLLAQGQKSFICFY